MPNRFSNRYHIDYRTHRHPEAEARANRLRQIAQALQLAGSVAGGIGGGALGFATGGPAGVLAGVGEGVKAGTSLGSMGAAPLNAQADELEDPERLREMKRMALLQALRR